jgi:lipopolysaccharide biosynthesis protein
VDSSQQSQGVIRAIAFHLPQFHPIPENDEWWGKGFTEWTNVAKARPLFRNHYQPHLPADLGFYDLRLPEARAAQAALAAEYGIYGFCYYHYWFNGRRILERPVNDILNSGEPDFPFCLCWANENWTRRWDGEENDVLLEQKYGAEDDLTHIRSLIPALFDCRYIRVLGKPMLLVYRVELLPDPQRTTEIWRREAERAGLGGLFLVRVESGLQSGDPVKLGFDAASQFQPHSSMSPYKSRIFRSRWWRRHKFGMGENAFRDNLVLRYEDLVRDGLRQPVSEYLQIPCVSPGWDNTPRRKTGATVFIESTPELYGKWLSKVVDKQRKIAAQASATGISPESLVFINAWNEWAEGNHLEPCRRWGRAYLEATRKALGVGAGQTVEHANR